MNALYLLKKQDKKKQENKKNLEKPAKLKAPNTKTATKCVSITFQKQRLNSNQFEKEISKINKELQQNNANVDNTLNNDFMKFYFI